MSCPIFILACGRRTGSTWVGRLLTSTKQVLVWGESNILSIGLDIAGTWTKDIGHSSDTDLHYFRKHGPQMPMAHLHPFGKNLRRHWATFAENVYLEAAQSEGYPRWGAKEVAWNETSLHFIREFWPDYRVIFLARNFVDVYRSIIGTNWVPTSEDKEKFIQEDWIKHSKLAASLEKNNKERIFRYEDLLVNYSPLLEWCQVSNPTNLDLVHSTRTNPTQADWSVAMPFEQEITNIHKQLGYGRK